VEQIVDTRADVEKIARRNAARVVIVILGSCWRDLYQIG
jgi:hypothetical protein